MNLEFLVVALIISKSVDWILQTQWQANNKTFDQWALIDHVTTYTLFTTALVVLITGITSILTIINMLILLWWSHAIIDQRGLIKKIMIWKGLSRHQVYSKEYGWLELGIDQRLHELVILGMALVI